MRVITFGELMLRLAPEGYERFVQADRLTAMLARAGKTSFAARNGVKKHICADFPFVKSIRCAVSEENEHIERLSDPYITICDIYYKIYLCNEVFRLRRGYGKNNVFRMSTCRKSKIYSAIQKNRGKSGGYGCSFYKEQGRARTKQIYKFDE